MLFRSPPTFDPNAGPNSLRRREAELNRNISGIDQDLRSLRQDLAREGNESRRNSIQETIKYLEEQKENLINQTRRPEFAEGGTAIGPSIVGEAGPEAVIPLRQGSIPVNINFDPMLAALTKQQRTMEDMADYMHDSVLLQERLLRATG